MMKRTKKDVFISLFVALVVACSGTTGFILNSRIDESGSKVFRGVIVASPVRWGRLGLELKICTEDGSDILVHFDRGGQSNHKLNQLKKDDPVIIEVLTCSKESERVSVIGINLIYENKTLFAKEKYLKRVRDGNLCALLMVFVSYSWLGYHFLKYLYKRRFRNPLADSAARF